MGRRFQAGATELSGGVGVDVAVCPAEVAAEVHPCGNGF